MEIQYYGANCVRLTTKKASITIDDNLADVSLKPVVKAGDIAVYTSVHTEPKDAKLNIDQPGEYEVSNASIQGIAARAHMDEVGSQTATMYKIIIEDIRLAAVGHIHPDLTDVQLESLGTVDILIIPVGGAGYTLDPLGALKVIKKVEPKIIIPTHYDDPAIKYPVPQVSLEEALKGLSMEPADTLDKLKLKSSDITEVTRLIVLNRQ